MRKFSPVAIEHRDHSRGYDGSAAQDFHRMRCCCKYLAASASRKFNPHDATGDLGAPDSPQATLPPISIDRSATLGSFVVTL